MNRYFRENAKDPVSSETHIIGAILSLIGTIILIVACIAKNTNFQTIIGCVVFGISAVCLYMASGIYHFYNKDNTDKTKKRLRKLDHSMIYVLIAGTYTPFVLTYLERPHAYYFLGIIWGVALLGVIIKLFYINAPRFLSTLFYLIMGWCAVFDFSSFSVMPNNVFFFVLLGGIIYSIGAIIYAFKKPNFFQSFGFHELFHIFIMAGTFCHFIAVFLSI